MNDYAVLATDILGEDSAAAAEGEEGKDDEQFFFDEQGFLHVT